MGQGNSGGNEITSGVVHLCPEKIRRIYDEIGEREPDLDFTISRKLPQNVLPEGALVVVE